MHVWLRVRRDKIHGQLGQQPDRLPLQIDGEVAHT
jgi:hypothetical protein